MLGLSVCVSVSVCVHVCELGFLDPETVRDCVCVNVCELGFLDAGTVRV